MVTNNIHEIKRFVNKQLRFVSKSRVGLSPIKKALERYIACVQMSTNKRISNSLLNTCHQVQYSTFLYYLSNTLFKMGEDYRAQAEAVYCLNKCLHSVDYFYEIPLPDHFLSEHPIGSILGRATYGDYLFIYQNCTIGSSLLKKPTIGNYVVLCSNSSILGDSEIGNYVIVSSGVTVINQKINDFSIVFPNGVIKDYSDRKNEIIEKIKILSEFNIDNIK